MSPDGADRDDRIDRAMAEFLAALERGDRPDRATYLAAYPDFAADLAPLLDEVAALHGTGRQVGTDAAGVSAAPLLDRHTRLGEFEILRVLGRGGMGVVYEAVQQPLGRRVALKVLPADAAIDPRLRRRFLHEARVAALLQHAHVVPVYAVGEVDRVQYYAMQCIDGRPLDAVLRVLRERAGLATWKPADPSSDAALLATGLTAGFPASDGSRLPAPSRARPGGAFENPDYLGHVVRLACDAAGALAYAHEAGVVHRDLKPGNLILDVRGKVWLTDFGLATLRDEAGADATTGRIGTLRYMSPEQAQGRRAEVDARTDVYALGLTLYELLTLRPAFSAATDTELLRQVVTTEPPRVRALNPAVPTDLETVVQKATAKDPADRYASAAEFAADLDRFQSGLPVAARRLTRLQRGWRWGRRHRRQLLAAGLALGLGLVLGLGLSTYFVWAAYREAETRRQQLAVREDELFSLVEQVNSSELVLKEVPGAQAEQRELVLRLKEVLARQADEPGASARVRWAAYRTCRRLVDVESRRGSQRGAAAAAFEARDRLAGLTRDDPRTRESRLELARCSRDLGGVFLMAGDGGAALEQNRAALALYEELDAERPGRTEVLNDLGHVRFAVAEGLAARGETGEAVALGRRALEVDQGLERRFSTGYPESHIRLCISHGRLAQLYCAAGDPVLAEEQFRKAVDSEAVLVRDFKTPDALRLYTVASRGRLGTFLAARGRHADARKELTACAADAERLGGMFAGDASYRHIRAECHQELGRVAYLEGNIEEARRWYGLMEGALRAGETVRRTMMLAAVPVEGVADPRALLAPADAALAATPTDVRVCRAVVRMRRGQYAAAEAHFEDIIRTAGYDRPSVGLATYYVALCRARQGKGPEAEVAFAAAEKMNWQDFASNCVVRIARREAAAALAGR